MAQKPSIPKGTRDFSPAEVAKRQYIMQIMRSNFEKFGFQPIETPSFENSETLMGKYGEEGDRLIFKILDSGDYFEKVNTLLAQYYATFFINFIGRIVREKNTKFLHDFVNEFRQENNSLNEEIIENLRSDLFREIKAIDLIDNDFFTIAFKVIKNHLKEFADFKIKYQNEDSFEFTDEENIFIIDKSVEAFGLWSINISSKKISKYISEKALRYDLTVPFARYVVQHQNEIEFPFKRYQIQPVWRADRPQKGRFREFYQCDADVVGSTSLWQEVELVQLYDSVFAELGLEGVTIKINNRKILSGIAEIIGASDKLIDFTVALDKLDKIGEVGVKKEMTEKGISAEALEKVQPLFSFTGTISEKLEKLSVLLAASEEGKKGIEELQFICDNVINLGLSVAKLDLDVTLARGLNYYTGAIFEVSAPEKVALGSIGGGGRYDDLTGIFGLKNMSGVGISFGLDRIYLVLEELNLFPETVTATSAVLFINYGNEEALYAMKAITALRKAGIKAELYPENAKLSKQFQHADKRGIPFAVIAGVTEMQTKKYALKNLTTGEQVLMDFEELKSKLR